jgi:large subunit ribosomal protein L3
MRGLIGKKVGMTRVFRENNDVVPVTVIEVLPCTVIQIKSKLVDGYDAVQVGSGFKSEKKVSLSVKAHCKKAGVGVFRHLREFESVPGFEYKPGQVFDVSLFKEGDYVNVSGTSKGRGFTGVIKRHNFRRQRKTHGNGHTERAPGSIGQASDPSRVFPGMRMAGHHGNSKVTIENLEVVKIDLSNNQLLLKGSVPGSRSGTLIISK